MRIIHISRLVTAAMGGLVALSSAAHATAAKLDDDTCKQLRSEQTKFEQSGILDEIGKGAEWAKANLSQDKLREIEHYMTLDEQLKFGCRDAKPSKDAEKAREAAGRIEINSDADPTAPAASGTHSKNPNKKKRQGHAKAEADPVGGAKTGKPKAGKAVKSQKDKNDAYTPAVAPPIVVEDPAKPTANGRQP